ncbi:MAG: BCCT family transporter, partial [Bacteroidota bacterium]
VIGLIGIAIISSFILSAISGLQKGIKILSNFNIYAFIVLAVFVLFLGPFQDIIQFFFKGVKEYATTFISRSINIGSNIDPEWRNDWTTFYFANWFAWAPIASLFLGKIAKGYSVRNYISFNLILPSIFAILWMSIFSGTTLSFNISDGNGLFNLMNQSGEEAVLYAVLLKLPLGKILSIVILGIIFLSYVTAADSNISAMALMSVKDEQQNNLRIKIAWGLVIGTLTYIMLASSGIDGIRMLSVLGGFPALFIIIGVAAVLIKLLFSKSLE